VVETIKASANGGNQKVVRHSATGKFVGGYKVLGKTSDGVQILKPKGRPKSFTVNKLRKVISANRAG
jgi:hypothetical protein